MKTVDFVKGLNGTKFYVLDTAQDGLSAKIIHGDGDINYIRYCYNIHQYSKLEEGGIILYRQTKRSSKNRKFYFFGGGRIEKIVEADKSGSVHAMLEKGTCFSLIQPVYEDDPKLDAINWTSKKKTSGEWGYFWNQYGMNLITEEEFMGIIEGTECVKVDADSGKVEIENLGEENLPVEKPAKKPEEFVGTYTKNGGEDKTHKPSKKGKKSVAKKIDYDSLNKTKKTRGTFGEILIYNDEVARMAELGITKKVDHVAMTQGDGLGYDIVSFDEKGNELYIEVKTTTAKKVDGFYLTPKELEIVKDKGANYRLYRVYNLNMADGTYSVEIFTSEEILTMFDIKAVSYVALKKEKM